MKRIIRVDHIWGDESAFDSVLIEDGVISRVADFDDVSSPGVETLRFRDSILLPGFTDAHLHLLWLGELLCGCDLRGCRNSREFRDRIQEHARTLSQGDFLFGYGYNENEWEDARKPDHNMIDDVTDGLTTIITRVDGHTWLLNSKAIVFANLSSVSDSELLSHIDNHAGKLTGIVYDKAYSQLVAKIVPKITDQKRREYLEKAQEYLLSLGITSCRSFGSLEDFLELAKMNQQNALKIRVCACLPTSALDWAIGVSVKTNSGTDKFWTGQIKMFADGSLGSKTALVSKPYSNGSLGLEVTTIDEMTRITEKAHTCGLGVAIHAIGDIAVLNVAKVLSQLGTDIDFIEHFQCNSKTAMNMLKNKEINVILNPSHIPLDSAVIPVEWGQLQDMAYPQADFWQTKMNVGFGSDARLQQPTHSMRLPVL